MPNNKLLIKLPIRTVLVLVVVVVWLAMMGISVTAREGGRGFGYRTSTAATTRVHSPRVTQQLKQSNGAVVVTPKSQQGGSNNNYKHPKPTLAPGEPNLPATPLPHSEKYLYDWEAILLKTLFAKTSYNNDVRPAKSNSQPVDVTLELVLLQINDLIDKEQQIVISGFLKINWDDERLTWDPSEYGDIEWLVTSARNVWLPDIALINSDDVYAVTRDGRFPVTITSTGQILYVPAGKIHARCELDLRFFPFDDQLCTYRFESWVYAAELVQINGINFTIDRNHYVDNHQWEIRDSFVQTRIVNYENFNFSRVEFYMLMRRKSLFFITYTIFPCLALSTLQIFSHMLPFTESERINFATTTLIAFSVFHVSIVEQMPQSSHAIPLLAIYIDALMCLIGLSLLECFLMMNWLSKVGCSVPSPRLWYYIVDRWGDYMLLGSNGTYWRRNYLRILEEVNAKEAQDARRKAFERKRWSTTSRKHQEGYIRKWSNFGQTTQNGREIEALIHLMDRWGYSFGNSHTLRRNADLFQSADAPTTQVTFNRRTKQKHSFRAADDLDKFGSFTSIRLANIYPASYADLDNDNNNSSQNQAETGDQPGPSGATMAPPSTPASFDVFDEKSSPTRRSGRRSRSKLHSSRSQYEVVMLNSNAGAVSSDDDNDEQQQQVIKDHMAPSSSSHHRHHHRHRRRPGAGGVLSMDQIAGASNSTPTSPQTHYPPHSPPYQFVPATSSSTQPSHSYNVGYQSMTPGRRRQATSEAKNCSSQQERQGAFLAGQGSALTMSAESPLLRTSSSNQPSAPHQRINKGGAIADVISHRPRPSSSRSSKPSPHHQQQQQHHKQPQQSHHQRPAVQKHSIVVNDGESPHHEMRLMPGWMRPADQSWVDSVQPSSSNNQFQQERRLQLTALDDIRQLIDDVNTSLSSHTLRRECIGVWTTFITVIDRIMSLILMILCISMPTYLFAIFPQPMDLTKLKNTQG